MESPVRRILQQSVIAAASAVTLVALATPAQAEYTLRANWAMNSLPTMVDSAGGDNNGTTANVTLAGGAYSFNGSTSTASAPDAANLDPGAANIKVSARISVAEVPAVGTTYDVIRKGTKDTVGGYYKLEIARSAAGNAIAVCRFKGGTTTGAATVYSTFSLENKGFVVITCTKTAGVVSVNAGGVVNKVSKTVGSISNDAAINIGSKGDGTDSFRGLMDYVKITIG